MNNNNSKEMLIPTERYQKEQMILNSFDKPQCDANQANFFSNDVG